MRRFSIILLLLITFAATAKTDQMSESKRLNAFFEEEWEYLLQQDPVFATLTGDLRYNDRLPDLSIDALKRQQQHDREVLKKLQSFDRSKLPDADKLNYDLYLQNTNLAIEGHQFPEHVTPITQLSGVQQNAPDLAAVLPFNNTKQYEDYISRLKQLPRLIDQTMERMREGLRQKITPPKITLRDVAGQIEAQITSDVTKSPFYSPFVKFADTVPAPDQERLRSSGRQAIEINVIPAYRKLSEFWSKEYYPQTRDSIAMSSLPNGQAWYAYRAKVSTTTDLTPKQIHDIGQQEVKRIRQQMDDVIREAKFKGSFQQFIEFLRNDPQFYYTKADDLLTGYRDICKRIDAELPRLFGKLPRLPYGVKEVPQYSAPSQTTAYYNQGSLKAGRPGWFYANTYKLNTRPKWEMEALSIHEAVPGHHLQIAIAQELENVPKFRTESSYTAFVEGWGLYSESLGPELGMYRDPYAKFGQLTYEMWRAVRLVVDTGMHVFGWDRQKAIDFFKANSSKPEHDIIVEIDRYIVWPGQALAYKIGELKIKELRKFATKELSQRFDIREFHDVVLGNGAVPLSILDENVKSYVERKKAAATGAGEKGGL